MIRENVPAGVDPADLDAFGFGISPVNDSFKMVFMA
jgi:hypothetical protein